MRCHVFSVFPLFWRCGRTLLVKQWRSTLLTVDKNAEMDATHYKDKNYWLDGKNNGNNSTTKTQMTIIEGVDKLATETTTTIDCLIDHTKRTINQQGRGQQWLNLPEQELLWQKQWSIERVEGGDVKMRKTTHNRNNLLLTKTKIKIDRMTSTMAAKAMTCRWG